MSDQRERRAWWRLHWPTWLWLSAIALGLSIKHMDCESVLWDNPFRNGIYRGWPVDSFRLCVVNSLTAAILVLGSAAKVEVWCHRRKGSLQFSVSALLAAWAWAALHFGIAAIREDSRWAFVSLDRLHVLSAVYSLQWFADGVAFIAVGLTSFALVDLLDAGWNRLVGK